MPVPKPDLYYDFHQILTLAGRVASSIRESGQRYHGIVGIANGGLVPTALISTLTGLPVLDLMRLRRYNDEEEDSDRMPEILRWPKRENVEDRDLLLTDDVVDEGYSFIRGRQLVVNDFGARLVHGAVLDFKLGPRKKHFPDLRVDYIGTVHPGRPWIQYSPWEAAGATHENALLMLVSMGHLQRSLVDRLLGQLREQPVVA
ncbi:MAG: hypothetical protein HY420_05300 [Candidatus Kerfeldbacteria bacterium]|nr:hypothetical protein [Candidatus Kerfeldbacteria bacterium]